MEYDVDQRLKNILSVVIAQGAISTPKISSDNEIERLQALFAYDNTIRKYERSHDQYRQAQDKVTRLSRLLLKRCIAVEKSKLSIRESSRLRHDSNIVAMQKVIDKDPPGMEDLERVFEFYRNLRAGKKGLRYDEIKFIGDPKESIEHCQATLDYAVSQDAQQFYQKLIVSIEALNPEPVPEPLIKLINDGQCTKEQWTQNLQKIQKNIHDFNTGVFHKPEKGQRFNQATQAYLAVKNGKRCYLSDRINDVQTADTRLCEGMNNHMINNAQRICVSKIDDNHLSQQASDLSANANRAIFGSIHLVDSDPHLDVSVLQCRTGSSSCCAPFYDISVQEGRGAITAQVYDINSDKIVSKVWAGENLHEATMRQLKSMVDSSGGVYEFFAKICDGQINQDGHVNGDLKLDNICFNVIDKSITIIDNAHKTDETPRDLFTGAIIATVSYTKWYNDYRCVPDTLIGTGNSSSSSWETSSIIDVWLKQFRPQKNTTQLSGYQGRYMLELVTRLDNRFKVDDTRASKCDKNALGESLMLEHLRFGQKETLHDIFALCTVAIQIVDRVDSLSNRPGQFLKKRAIDYQNKILAKLSEVVQDAQNLHPHVALNQLQRVMIIEAMNILKAQKKRDPTFKKSQVTFDDIRDEFDNNLDHMLADINQKLPESAWLTRKSVNDYKDYLIYVLPKLEALNDTFSLKNVKVALLPSENESLIALPCRQSPLIRADLDKVHSRKDNSSDDETEGHTSGDDTASVTSLDTHSSYQTTQERHSDLSSDEGYNTAHEDDEQDDKDKERPGR